MIVAHRILLDPNNCQATYFAKASGNAMFAWNWALREWERQYHAGLKPNGQTLKKQFSPLIKSKFPFMMTTSSYAYQRVFPELDNAYQRFFKGLANRPTPKKRGSRKSFYLANTCIQVVNRRVKIAKLGWVRMRKSLRYAGKIMSARISERAGKWFISIAVELPDAVVQHPAPHTSTGVDLGIKALATLANGQKVLLPDITAQDRQMKRLQRKLAKQEEFSGRWKDTKRKIARKAQQIANIRDNARHQLTASLVKENAVIGLEDLAVKGMTSSAKGTTEDPGKMVKQKSGLNRSILASGFGEIRRQVEYKARRTGSRVVIIDRFAPTTKACSACGAILDTIPLSVRAFDCKHCGAHHDRDINAAKNIRTLALTTPVATPKARKSVGKILPTRRKPAGSESTGGTPGTNARGPDGNASCCLTGD